MAILGDPVGKKIKLTIEQGVTETLACRLTFTDTGLPLDLTGYTGVAKIRESFPEGPIVIEFTLTFTNRVNGEFVLTLSDAQTQGLSTTSSKRVAQIGYWDVTLTSASGDAQRFYEGEAYLSQNTLG